MKRKIIFIHRNLKAGYSINKVVQTVISNIKDKREFYVPCANASLISILKNLLYCFHLRNNRDIFHITGDIHYCILSLIGCNTILTIHDTVHFDYLEYGWFKKNIIKWLWYKLPIKYAKHVVCISEETKKSILKFTNRTDIKVIYNAVDPAFRQVDKNIRSIPPKILIIGTNPNKNIENTFLALKGIDCQIVIIGKLSEQQIQILKELNLSYINKTNLTDEQIIEEYNNTDFVTFISKFEGFGMIVVEANKVGRPLICSNIPILCEIAGDSALFVNPFDIQDMKNGFIKLIEDSPFCSRLVQNGFINVKRFSVDKILSQWLDYYNNIL